MVEFIMKKQIIFSLSLLLIFGLIGCNSTSSNIEAQEIIPAVDGNTTNKNNKNSKKENFEDNSIVFEEESGVVTEEVIQLTTVELYQNFVDQYNFDVYSTPNQITKNKQFAKPFSVKITQNDVPTANVLVTVKYPVAQTNGVISFGQEIIQTDESGIASFTPTTTNFSCNSNVYFFLTPETEDEDTLRYAEENALSIPYKVITNRFWDSGVLALVDYNASNRTLSTNTTATALQPPLRKAGFQTIGNAPFDASVVTGKNLYAEAKSIFGSTVSFILYGTVKYAEPAQILEDNTYSVTFVTDFSVMNLRDGKIVYHEEFYTTETGATEWDATNKLRTKTIPELITEKIIYGI